MTTFWYPSKAYPQALVLAAKPRMKRKATYTKAPPAKRSRTGSRPVKGISAARAIEWKNYDLVTPNPIVAAQATAVRTSIFNADQGTASSEHVGRSVKMGSLLWNMPLALPTAATGSSAIRLAIVYDRQPNAALPVTLDVWTVDAIHAMPNKNNKRRFKVLVDEKLEGLSTNGPSALYSSGIRKFKVPLETYYNDVNGGTIADITTGSYIMFTWQTGQITTNANGNVYTRLTFMDA